MKFSSPSHSILLLIALVNFYFLIAVRICDDNGRNWQTVIYSDGKGYYEYLRSGFINHNFSNQDSTKGFVRNSEGKYVIKFFSGVAIAQLPFFTIAYLISALRNHSTDGYSFEFQFMIAIAGYCYLLLGLIFLRKFLLQITKSEWVLAVTLLLITYATNLFYYAILEPSMSHVYAFAFISIFLFQAGRYLSNQKMIHLIFASVALSLTILIRPTNGVIIFMIPFLCGDWQTFFNAFSKPLNIFGSILIMVLLLMIQPLLWKIQTGSWFVWSYSGEGFYFFSPSVFNVLLSYNKGWLIYSPLVAISFFGLVAIWKRNRLMFFSVLFTIASAVYFTAAWWCWNYGDSYGARTLIDFYPLVATMLLSFLSEIKNGFFKVVIGILLCSLMIFSCIQTYQYYEKILQHYSMDKEKYWYIFLKTNNSYRNLLGGNIDLMPYSISEPQSLLVIENNFSKQLVNWNSVQIKNDPLDSLNNCCLLSEGTPELKYNFTANDSIRNAEMLWVEIQVRRMELTPHSSSGALVTASLSNEDENVFNYQFALNDFPDENVLRWRTYNYKFWIRKPLKKFNTISFSIVKNNGGDFLLDDINIKVSKINGK